MQSVIIAGGTGLVGQRLDHMLRNGGFEVRILTRHPEKYNNPRYFKWDVERGILDENIFPADIIINLAGESIAKSRWTKRRKEQIVMSRVNSSRLLLKTAKTKQKSLVQYIGASAIGFYGHRGDDILSEKSVKGDDFLAGCTCKWELASKEWSSFSTSLLIFRIGIVLSKSGGVLGKMLLSTKFGMANFFGSGRQYYSWIHIDDLCSMIIFGIENNLNGIFNAVSPNPEKNKDFMKTLQGEIGHYTILLPIPHFVMKTVMGEMEILIMNSNRVSASKIIDEGFDFTFEKLNEAIRSLIN